MLQMSAHGSQWVNFGSKHRIRGMNAYAEIQISESPGWVCQGNRFRGRGAFHDSWSVNNCSPRNTEPKRMRERAEPTQPKTETHPTAIFIRRARQLAARLSPGQNGRRIQAPKMRAAATRMPVCHRVLSLPRFAMSAF